MLNKVVSIVLITLLSGFAPSVAQTSDPAPQEPSSIASTEVAQNPSGPEEGELSYEELRRFARAFSMIKNRYVEPISEQQLVDSAIKGMLADLDPHSIYLNKEDMTDLQEETDGEFGGLGIEIGEESGFVKVIAPIEGTPAARAGILTGDLIIKVNGENMKDKPINEVIKLLRGDAGSEVVLTIKRPSSEAALDFSIQRERIKIRSVRSKMIDDIAYFRISQFQANTVGELTTQIRRISERNTPKAIVLDLRNDPGGLLNVAVGVVQAFTNTDRVIVSTKARSQLVDEFSNYEVENLSYGTNPLSNMPAWTKEAPMVVLINVGSASASEIVAGALQDFKRATVMGNRSFGKGSVQVVLPLDEETGIKLTTARYYTPLGRSIQATGITPDIIVSDTEKGDLFSFPREVDLNDHLENESNKTPKEIKVDVEKRPTAADMFEFGSDQDFQLQQALNHLLGRTVNPGVVSPIKPLANTSEDKTDPSSEPHPDAATPVEPKHSDEPQQKSEPAGLEHEAQKPEIEKKPEIEQKPGSTESVGPRPRSAVSKKSLFA